MLPFVFLRFWFIDSPKNLIAFFASLNNAFLQLFSLPLLVNTYFKPWKNEYREGLIGFSIGMGIFVKTFVIVADVILLFILLLIEFCLFVGFIFLLVLFIFCFIYSYSFYFFIIQTKEKFCRDYRIPKAGYRYY